MDGLLHCSDLREDFHHLLPGGQLLLRARPVRDRRRLDLGVVAAAQAAAARKARTPPRRPPGNAATPEDANDARPDAQRARHDGLMDEDDEAAAAAAPRGPPLPTLS